MPHLSPTDTIAAIAVAVSVVLGVVTLIQTRAYHRIDLRNKALEDEKKAMEAEKRAEEERIAGIVKERAEIAAENRTLRADLRLDIERLKDESTKSRDEAAKWRAIATDWEAKYNRELLANTRLQESNLDMKASITRLEAEVISLRNRLNDMSAAAPAVPTKT
jgi:hypothetical protein